MIDIHCHILPGIDDGAETLAESIIMAQTAHWQGIDTIVATPHHRNGAYDNPKTSIEGNVKILNDHLKQENIPVTILPGQETRLHGDMDHEIETNVIAPLNDTKYVFVEFPFDYVPRYAMQTLFNIQVAGFVPIIVHPERNSAIQNHPSLLYDFVLLGALSQVTAGCLTGEYGKKLRKFSHQLIAANLAHFVASDAHNTSTRGFSLNEAYQAITSLHGEEKTSVFMENVQLLINGMNVHQYEAGQIKKHKFLGLL